MAVAVGRVLRYQPVVLRNTVILLRNKLAELRRHKSFKVLLKICLGINSKVLNLNSSVFIIDISQLRSK